MLSKNLLILFVVLLSMVGCSRNNTEDQSPADSEFAKFNNLFRDTSSVQYHVYSYENYNYTDSRIKIAVIPKSLYKFIEPGYDSLKEPYQEYFAVYKFDYKRDIKGYIYTYVSQYSPSVVGIILYDKNTQTILGNNEIADCFGDEGWYFQKDGWLKDINNDGYLDILNRKIDWSYDIGDDEDSVVTVDTVNTVDAGPQMVSDSIFAYTYNFSEKRFVRVKSMNYNPMQLVLQKLDN